jgi:glycerophosphoryl diester phosphodiesterase
MEVRRNGSRPWLVGHRGAAALGPENTVAGLEAALGAGVDMVEFDVLPLADGTLVLAHSDDLLEITHGRVDGRLGNRGLAEVRELEPDLPTLDEALAFLAERAPSTGLVVDVKGAGFEHDLAAALTRHGVDGRTAVSSAFPRTLRRMGELAPGVRLSLSYPLDRRRVSRHRALAPAIAAALLAMRAVLPARIGRWLASTGATLATLHYLLASPAVIRACHRHGAAVFVWTVDDESVLRSAVAAGVDGVITNDPRIFRGYPV